MAADPPPRNAGISPKYMISTTPSSCGSSSTYPAGVPFSYATQVSAPGRSRTSCHWAYVRLSRSVHRMSPPTAE